MSALVVSIHQPNLHPWVKLLDKILASDVFVAYDTVQYAKSEFHGRQRVRTPAGATWLSVPLVHVRGSRQMLRDVRIDLNQPFVKRHLKTLRYSYAKSPFFDDLYPQVEEVYLRRHTHLVDLSLDLLRAVCDYLGSQVSILRARDLPHSGDTTQRVIDLVRAVGGTVHLTSTYGTERRYLDWRRIQQAGIALRAQEFEHPVYDQVWGGFVPDLAALDMLFSCGPATAEILAGRRRIVSVDPSADAERCGALWQPASR